MAKYEAFSKRGQELIVSGWDDLTILVCSPPHCSGYFLSIISNNSPVPPKIDLRAAPCKSPPAKGLGQVTPPSTLLIWAPNSN